jgi:hypothetical protein
LLPAPAPPIDPMPGASGAPPTPTGATLTTPRIHVCSVQWKG